MKYPESLKVGDTIGITAPSAGIIKEDKILKLEYAERNLEKLGYKCIETNNVRTDEYGRSSSGEIRAKEFMELWKNPNVKSIIAADGGEFEPEILDYLDLNEIKESNPKWFQGYSDNTNLGFVLTTKCDIATIYGANIKTFAMKELYRDLKDSIRIMNGEEIEQESFVMHEGNWLEKIIKGEIEEEVDPTAGYLFENKVEWKNLKGEEKISFSGRAIGGCFDVITNLIGTKYDNISEFIEKYKPYLIYHKFDDGEVRFTHNFYNGFHEIVMRKNNL